MLKMIVAATPDGVIGHGDNIPWHCPNDLAFFKMMTCHSTVLMGRKTFDSIIKLLGKPLPKRHTMVLTRDIQKTAAKVDAILQRVKVHRHYDVTVVGEDMASSIYGGLDDVWLCGGAEIYAQFLPDVAEVYLTTVNTTIKPPLPGQKVKKIDINSIKNEFTAIGGITLGPGYSVTRYERTTRCG